MMKMSPGTIATTLAILAVAALLPLAVGVYQVMVFTNLAIMAIFALSVAWIWGYGGILCFGQSAFFGIGAYTYAISMINMGESTVPLLLAIALPTIFAALLGAGMFYGRVSDVYFAVITLCVTLILFSLISSTAGPEYRIFAARLNGQNGISGFQTLNYPGLPGAGLGPREYFYLVMALLAACYLCLKSVIASRFGRIVLSVRENPLRAELLGYDTRWIKTCVFTLGGALAGLAGMLFANWGAFVNPSVFALQMAAMPLIWVVVGGLGTLVGPILGAFALQYLANYLGKQQFANTGMVLGALLICFVMLVPQGIVPSILRLVDKLPANARSLNVGRGKTRTTDEGVK